MTTQQPARRDYRVDMEIQAAIIGLTSDPNTRRTAAEIHRLLSQREEFKGRVPSRRTVERMVHGLSQQAPPAKWHWSDYGAEDARILLEVMNMLIEHHIGSDDPNLARYIISSIPEYVSSMLIDTKEAADWIVRIAKVAPDLSTFAVFMMAQIYLLHHRAEASTSGLDTYLAMRPWRDRESATKYLQALNDKLIPPIQIQEGLFIQALQELYEIHVLDLEPPRYGASGA